MKQNLPSVLLHVVMAGRDAHLTQPIHCHAKHLDRLKMALSKPWNLESWDPQRMTPNSWERTCERAACKVALSNYLHTSLALQWPTRPYSRFECCRRDIRRCPVHRTQASWLLISHMPRTYEEDSETGKFIDSVAADPRRPTLLTKLGRPIPINPEVLLHWWAFTS